jgi:hypothetical protein
MQCTLKSRCPILLSTLFIIAFTLPCYSQGDGYLHQNGDKLFPIGMYELPGSDAALKVMADAGINVVRCYSKEDLDRLHAANLYGWMPLPVHLGATAELREKIMAVKDHPALALWEGPDEVIWNFTAYSGLAKSAGVEREDWWNQRPNAVAYSAEKASVIMPNIREAVNMVRELDDKDRQFWINEARHTDPVYVRDYLDDIDIIGCDDYPVRRSAAPENIARMGGTTKRWMQLGQGKPVYMVLQSFSWTELDKNSTDAPFYPSFEQSRFMAYDVIARGAKGVMYWGSHYLKSDAFRTSLYALTKELSALQPFLVVADELDVTTELIEGDDKPFMGVKVAARRVGREWLIILVNEDNQRHMGCEVQGLEALNGYDLVQLYGDETVTINNGEFITRIPALAVKVFSTSKKWECGVKEGRDFKNE